MIIENGTLQAITSTAGQLVHGRPTQAVETTSDPIPCNIRKNKSDHQGTYQDGNFTQRSGIALIDPQAFVEQDIEQTAVKRVKLTDNLGQNLGEFEVQDIEYLEATDALQITF